MKQKVQRFKAVADDGKMFMVIEYADVVSVPAGGSLLRADGVSSWELSDGRDVNMRDAETFQILDTNQIIRKIG